MHLEEWRAKDVAMKILEMKGACNNQKARMQLENGTLEVSSSPFYLKGYIPDYQNEKWDDIDISDLGKKRMM